MEFGVPEAQDDQSGITRKGSAGTRVHDAPAGHRSLGRSAGLFGMYLIDMMKLSKRRGTWHTFILHGSWKTFPMTVFHAS